MDRRGGGLVVRSLIAAVAALLTVGGWAAVTVGPDARTTVVADDQVGAASLSQAGLVDEPAAAASLPVGITAPPPPPLPPAPTTTRRGPATTKPDAATTTTAAATPGRTTTTVPPLPPGNMPAASSWKADVPGLSIRMRIEPEAPVVGQTFPETGPPFRHIEMPACIAVGPGTAGATGCAPAPNPIPFLPPPPPAA